MQRLRTVRFSYLYIFGGSTLLSGASLFAIHLAITALYSHYSVQSDALFVRLIHWIINHIGTTPCAVLLFAIIFCGFYMLRSQKIADDLHAVLIGTKELASREEPREIKVLSGGQLGEIAANLNRIQRVVAPVSHVVQDPGSDDMPAVALLLRTREILRSLHEAEVVENKVESEVHIHLAAAHSEVRSMERFLENLIIES